MSAHLDRSAPDWWLDPDPDVPLPCSTDLRPGDLGVDEFGRIEEQYEPGGDE